MHALTLLVPAASVEAVCAALGDELEALSTSIEDADAGAAGEQPVFDEPGVGATGTWQRALVSALFDDEKRATGAAAALLSRQAVTGATVLSLAAVDDRDWVRLTQAQFGASEVTPGFWIVPSWSPLPANATHVIRLDPGRAFGTGAHPTTRMCLRWLARRGSQGKLAGTRVLDYGCGSGVLAIAAALFGAGSVDAVDIDASAVEATRANALANGVALRSGATELAGGRYGVVVANILAAPLKVLAPLLAALLDDTGELVLAGILERQVGELRAAYAPWLTLEATDADNGWSLLTGTRASGPHMA